MRRSFLALTFAIAASLSLPGLCRAEIVLYDGSLASAPGSQGWSYLTNPLVGSSASQTIITGGVRLDTTAAISDQAGYFSKTPLATHPLNPNLDRTTGYTVSWDVALKSETHSSNDRAGFSVIVLGNDGKGIELGFWTDTIFAQADNPLFTKAESVSYNTTDRTLYELAVIGSTYTLFADGSSILTGSLRDYSAFGLPYTQTNFVFLGDDTSSASADVSIYKVSAQLRAVPEPSAFLLMAAGGGLLFAAARRRIRCCG